MRKASDVDHFVLVRYDVHATVPEKGAPGAEVGRLAGGDPRLKPMDARRTDMRNQKGRNKQKLRTPHIQLSEFSAFENKSIDALKAAIKKYAKFKFK